MSESAESLLLDYIENFCAQPLSAEVTQTTKTFVLDSIAVGLSGSRVNFVPELIKTAQAWGQGREAQVWSTGEYLPCASAALVNAYQIHNQEFDCVHEAAVVHPMAVILSTLMAFSQKVSVQKTSAQAEPISGARFIQALILAVDIATTIGMCASKPMRFFRPGVAGCFGATAALAWLSGFSRAQTQHAMGIAYSQMGGTMQAHKEGSPTLPMQVAFNARNAITAVDLAAAGLTGPQHFLDGPFGFFALMDDDGNRAQAFEQLGRVAQMTRVSHKPFPTGRAAHGGLDGIARLQAQYGFSAADIEQIHIAAPPLVLRLVDRPASPEMNANYAKLCMGYIAACYLLTGAVTVADFDTEKIAIPERQLLAQRLTMGLNTCPDANALAPQTVHIHLRSGVCLTQNLPAVLGHPEQPLTREKQEQKFFACCASAARPLAQARAEQLLARIDQLENLVDVAELMTFMTPNFEGS